MNNFHKIIEHLPSICYISFLIIPYLSKLCVESNLSNASHLLGIGTISMGILISDYIISKKYKPFKVKAYNFKHRRILFAVIMLIVIIISSIKLFYFDASLWLKYLDGQQASAVSLERDKFEAAVGGWMGARILNPFLHIFGILTFSGLVFYRKQFLAVCFFGFLSVVLLLSTAKAPALIVFFSCLLFLAYHCSRFWTLPPLFFMAMLPILSCAAVFYFYFKIHPLYQKHYAFVPLPQEMSDDAGDQYRRLRKDRWIEQTAATYLAYRLFFVPIGVSARWYEFAQLPPAEKELSRDGASSLANAIGRWAYTGRFSEEYLPHVRAYASLDADAFCRFAMPGVLLAALGYMATRIVLFLSCGGTTDPLQQGLYSQGLILCSFVPYQGSLQALLGPQGVLLIILLGFFLQWIYCKRNTA